MKRLLTICAVVVLGLVMAAPVAAATPIYVNAITGSDLNDGQTLGTAVAKITKGIQLVDSGGTVYVAAGTYTNDIWDSSLGVPAGYRITKSITLLGAKAGVDPAGSTDRGGESILVRTNGVPYSLYNSNITLDGFTFTSGGGSGGGRIIVSEYGDDAIIRNCIIKDISGTDPHGIYIYPGAENVLIEYNTLSNTAWEAISCNGEAEISNNTIKDIPSNKGIYLGASSNAEISGNNISNTYYEGIQAWGSATITQNNIEGCYKGIQVRENAAGSMINNNTISDTTYEGIESFVQVTITNNDISGAYKGIALRASGSEIDGNKIHDNQYWGVSIESSVTDATVTNNQLTNNPYCGVIVWEDGEGSGININFNNITGNGIFGVESQRDLSNVDATNNWWGHASGPSGSAGRTNNKGKVIGKGDAVSTYVEWDPWLPQPVNHTPHHPVPPGLFK